MRKILVILTLIIPFGVGAQLLKMMSTPNQAIIKEAVKDGICIIAQNYQLEDSVSGQRYGRNGANNFGCSYSLCIKLKNGLCLNIDALTPWENDANYNRYRGQYSPINTETQYKELNDSCFISVSLPDMNSINEISDSLLYELTDTVTFDGMGFERDSIAGNKDGWLVWVVADRPITEADSATTDMIITKYGIDASPHYRIHEVNKPATPKHVWGGIFVVPQQTAIGQLTFRLCGVMLNRETDKWVIVTPFTTETMRVYKQSKIKLTPVTYSYGDKSIKELE